MNAAIIFFTPILLLLASVAVVKLRRLGWHDDVGLKAPEIRALALWLPLFLALAVAAEIVSHIAGLTGSAGDWRGKYNSTDLVIRVIAVGLIYPLAEELFFRGALLGVLKRRFGDAVAIFGSATVFAAIHVQYDWRGIAFVFVDGLFFALCRVRTGSVILVMLFHVLGNSYAVWERLYG